MQILQKPTTSSRKSIVILSWSCRPLRINYEFSDKKRIFKQTKTSIMKHLTNRVIMKTILIIALCSTIGLTGCAMDYMDFILLCDVPEHVRPNTFENSTDEYPLGNHTVEARHHTADDHSYTLMLSCFEYDTLVIE